MCNIALKEPKYKREQCILSLYENDEKKILKLVYMSVLRNAGVEDDDIVKIPHTNDEKLDNNICRAKQRIFELAFCNPWDWFFTGTLDASKYDRTNLEQFHADITQFFRLYGRKHKIKISFLLIPELHSDGKTWHMHGLLQGLPENHLQRFKKGMRMGKALADKVLAGDAVFNWKAYQEKFGFCDLEPVRNTEAVSKYITKYITKDLERSVTDVGAHLFYHSRGLKGRIVKKKGSMTLPVIKPSYPGKYCSVWDFPWSEETEQYLTSLFVE